MKRFTDYLEIIQEGQGMYSPAELQKLAIIIKELESMNINQVLDMKSDTYKKVMKFLNPYNPDFKNATVGRLSKALENIVDDENIKLPKIK